jgi:hypothetical protein
MTDWLPWGFVLMAGTFTTLALALRGIQRTAVGDHPDLRNAWWSLGATVALSLGVYALYLLFGERWVWHLQG